MAKTDPESLTRLTLFHDKTVNLRKLQTHLVGDCEFIIQELLGMKDPAQAVEGFI